MKKVAVGGAIAILIVAIVFTFYAGPVWRHPIVLFSLTMQPASATLPVPIAGVAPRSLVDSWGSPRPGGRGHQGIDIFARRGTPIHSATRGIVVKVGENELGGHVVKVFGPGGEWHYYAHLDHFAGVHAGDVIRAGTILGYVGNTGDAVGTPTHLHYGIYSRVGLATDPYLRLTSRGDMQTPAAPRLTRRSR
jgi:murein DD-endopeptidase MepM/ murein hydrolase activator NlpD